MVIINNPTGNTVAAYIVTSNSVRGSKVTGNKVNIRKSQVA